MKSKILIAGGSHADIPIIKAAQNLGYFVVTSGNNKDDLGHQYSDEYFPADFSDKEAILELAVELEIVGICASANDFSALSCAYAAEKLGLKGHDSVHTSEIIHHKDKYRKFATENKVFTPQFQSFQNQQQVLDAINSFKFPVIVKPIDLTGGKGISVANNIDELKTATTKAFQYTRANKIVIEEYLDGSRHGFSTFLVNGKVKFHFLDDEHYHLNPYLVSAASTPSSIHTPSKTEEILIKEAEKIAKLLQLKDGIFHIQFILKNETPYIVEICRRTPGDLYIKLVEHATGINYPEWIVRGALGLDCSKIRQAPVEGYYTRHCIMASKKGAIRDVLYDETIKNNVVDEFVWWKKGNNITDVLTHKCGIVFLKFTTFEEMINKTKKMQQLIKVDVT